ncbi:MAG: type III pantothenate kinase [Desulfobulbaceae bacterium]|nr:type III pantothenate kinase [Desulfobulbaceae bacterium]MDY0350528.1 type III pantothenate kinase [Desulfobulbaceae bacterium]
MESETGEAMLLAVDVGNSHTVSGIFSGDELVAEWRLQSDRDRTGDELAIRYHTLLEMQHIRPEEITGFIVSSVVPTLETAWMSYAARYLGGQLTGGPLSVDHTTRTDIAIAAENPAEVGADRIVNSVAAWHRFRSPVIVIDFGTAITFDCINGSREYLGGAIVPGLGISLDALAARTAKLPRVDIDKPPRSVIGRTSVDAIRSGLLVGFGGLVDRLVDRLSAELAASNSPVNIIGTGGMAHLIAPYSRHLQIIEPHLTLRGLQIIYALNSGHAR